MCSSNWFTLGAKRALFALTSRINHSCSPNLVRTFSSGGAKVTLTFTRDIRPGEQLFIQYSAVAGHEDRLFFECPCELTEQQRVEGELDDRNQQEDSDY